MPEKQGATLGESGKGSPKLRLHRTLAVRVLAPWWQGMASALFVSFVLAGLVFSKAAESPPSRRDFLGLRTELRNAGFQLATQVSRDGLRVELNIPSPESVVESIGGKSFTFLKFGAGAIEQGPGGEAVPVLLLPVVVSPSAKVSLELNATVWNPVNVDRLIPFSLVQGLPDTASVERFSVARRRVKTFWAIGFASEGRFRGYRIVRVRIPLLRPTAGGYEQLRRVEFRIRGLETEIQPATAGAFARAVPPVPVKNLVLNPSSPVVAERPRSLPHPFEPGKVKILLSDSGFYRVTGRDLAGAGVSLAEIDPSTIRLHSRGREIPFFLRRTLGAGFQLDDTLFFYAPALHGDTCFVYPYSDTNVVWLDWGGEGGLRFQEQRVSAGGNAPAETTFVYLVHLEDERIYYDGDSDLSIKVTDTVPGEGWIWKRFYPGDTWRIRFAVQDLVFQGDDSAEVRVRVRGTTLAPTNPDHHLVVQVNGHEVGDAFFDDRDELVFSARFPAELLHTGENEIMLSSVAVPGVYLSQFYLDWVEVAYPRKLRVGTNDPLDAWLGEESRSGTISVVADSTAQPLFINLSAGTVLKGVTEDRSFQMSVRVLSAGYADGNRCVIQVGGKTVVQGGHRGHNLVVLDPRNGVVKEVRWFDTYRDTSEANAMAAFIDSLPESTVVLAGIRDEGSVSMTARAYAALRTLGSALSEQVGTRDSWCLVGWKGAAPGSVAEVWKPQGSGPAEVDTSLVFPEGFARRFRFVRPSAERMHLLVVDPRSARLPDRIILDHSGNLADTTRGADYVIVTHSRFMPAARRLAEYRRTHNGFRVAVVDVQDIYDEFNDGIKDPRAIRDFVTYAFWKWEKPSVRFLLLFGDASWDFHGSSEDAKYRDFVPSFGKPVSDSRFACVDGPNDRLPDLATGRIAVGSLAEAEQVVGKIMEYERQPPAPWVKRALLISGGFDHFEQSLFGGQNRRLAQRYLGSPPASLVWTMVNKKTEGYYEGEGREDIARAIDRGLLWVNFIGHAGSRTWDLMYHHQDVDELENAPAYPFVTSMTCHTARFANPYQESFGEHFVNAADRGAIGFLGTSGWGYVHQDELYLEKIFQVTFRDSVRSLGDIVWLAKLRYWSVVGEGTLSQTMVDQYTLLGDPATSLALPVLPDLSVGPEDLILEPARPSLRDSVVSVTLRIHNYGLATPDSVSVSLTDLPESGVSVPIYTAKLPPLGCEDSLTTHWLLPERAGRHVLMAEVRADSSQEVSLANNHAEIEVEVTEAGAEARWPPSHAFLPLGHNVTLQLAIDSQTIGKTLQIELDTTDEFDSQLLRRTEVSVSSGQQIARWDVGELEAGTYWWRYRVASTGDTSVWSSRVFRVGPMQSGSVGWLQSGGDFGDSFGQSVKMGSKGVTLAPRWVKIRVESAGYVDGNYARILVDDVPVIEPQRGHNLAVISPQGRVVAVRTFDVWKYPEQADSLAVFVDNIQVGYYVAAAIRDEGSKNLNERVFSAYESIGSALCRQIGPRDSWAIWGRKGFSPGQAHEVLKKSGTGAAVVVDSLQTRAEGGVLLSPWIGPGWRWKQVEAKVVGSGTVDLFLLGKPSAGATSDTLMRLPTVQDSVSRNVPVAEARWVRLAAIFRRGRSDSARLVSWGVTYTPPADLAVGQSGLVLTPDSLLFGQTTTVAAVVRNWGPARSDTCVAVLQVRDETGQWRSVAESAKVPPLLPDSTFAVRWVWQVREPEGRHLVRIVLDPSDRLVELDEANNVATTRVAVAPDSTAPTIRIFADGQPFLSGDHVAPSPTLQVEVHDQGIFTVRDTSRLRILLDDKRLSATSTPALEWHFEEAVEGKISALVTMKPVLDPGSHILQVTAWDLAGNRSEQWFVLRVADELEISHVLNFPNPFANLTTFTYFLSLPADEVAIRVFTLSGRKVWETESAGGCAGYNAFEWDGRDQEGDELADGVYLYKITARSGRKSVSALGKLAIVR